MQLSTLYKSLKRIGVLIILIPILVCATYLLAATIGAFIPAPENNKTVSSDSGEQTVDIYLMSTILHVDIAIPATEDIKRQFGFLNKDGFPLTHPGLKYLVIGWGSERFYTSTKTLKDIGLGPVLTAVTGDRSVLHVIPTRDISKKQDAVRLKVSASGFQTMIDNMLASFATSTQGKRLKLDGINHGVSDVFYQAKGNFNLLHPCNIWTARMLRSAGVKTGIWTPTTFSLMLSLD